MRNRKLGPSLATALLAFGFVACGDDGPTAPKTPFDPDATAQAVAELEGRLDHDGDVMQSLYLVAPALEAEAGAVLALIPGGVTRAVRPFDAQVMVNPSFSMAVEPIFPVNLLGVTFEWDETLGRYAVSERPGAPSNGVRFILYAVDPFAGSPVLPLSEVGFLDLTDESTAAQTRLGVYAETGSVARLDYTVTASYAILGQTIRATAEGSGFISDGSRRLDFDLVQDVTFDSVNETIGIDLLYDLEMADEDVRVVVDVASVLDANAPESLELAVTMTITRGGDVTVLRGTTDLNDTIDGDIRHNGEVVVLIGGSASAPTFTDAAGAPLTTGEIAALSQIFSLVDDVFDFAEAIFEPFGSDSIQI